MNSLTTFPIDGSDLSGGLLE